MKKIIVILMLCTISLLSAVNRESEFCNIATGQLEKASDSNGSSQTMGEPTYPQRDVTIEFSSFDDKAILKETEVSPFSTNAISAWHLNNKHIEFDAFVENPSFPWISAYCGTYLPYAIDYHVNITDDGTIIPSGCDDTMKLFDNESNMSNWTYTPTPKVLKVDCTNDRNYFFVAVEISAYEIEIRCYDIQANSLLWSVDYATQAFKVKDLKYNEEKNFVLVTMVDEVAVLNADDGNEEFFCSTSFTNTEADISFDGNLIVFAESNPNRLRVFEYSQILETFTLRWQYTIPFVSPNQYVSWGFSASISGDGSTIVLGTLQVYNDNSKGGGVICFDSSSPTPLWSKVDIGHLVYSLDMSWDGNIIAAGSWGPINGNGPDFFMFGRTSNNVLFDFTTNGSVFPVSISEDGTYCTFGGKAVHANILGNGGFLYGIKSDFETKTYTFPSQWTIPDCGWKWLSFDILYPEEDDNIAEFFLAPISEPTKLDRAWFKPHSNNSNPAYISFDEQLNLDHLFTSPYGYKFHTFTECQFTVTGQRCPAETTFPLFGNNQENWIGYFLEETQHIYDAFADQLANITGLRTQHWAIKKPPNGIWPDVPYTISPGDMVIAYCDDDVPLFTWNYTESREKYTVLESQDFNYEEESDYIPVFIELDPNDLPSEIGAYVDGECKGATVVQDTTAQICAYVLENQGEDLEFEFSYGSREQNKRIKEYGINEPETSKTVKGTIQIDNSRDCYYVSFKDGQNNTPVTAKIEITNFPNPFNPETMLFFSLPNEQEIELTVYNLKGQKVKQLASGQFPDGEHSIVWNGKDDNGKSVGSGLYLYKLKTGDKVISKKMLLLK
ncbi:MAG: T9SS type A sorting domain-containing protein [Candidatus Cloacimonadales bacterium]|nr:T9SS type A sorting domain-containing protein [Candidatus Cloacimonadales bacterium]